MHSYQAPAQAGTDAGQKSRPKVPVQGFEASDGFREFFLASFARWLQLNFRAPEQVAAVFGVRHQTALNWWNGRNRASGDVVGLVFLTFPAATAWFLAEWEGRD
jgi:hypothetical protein